MEEGRLAYAYQDLIPGSQLFFNIKDDLNFKVENFMRK